jgi:hypothetical protein
LLEGHSKRLAPASEFSANRLKPESGDAQVNTPLISDSIIFVDDKPKPSSRPTDVATASEEQLGLVQEQRSFANDLDRLTQRITELEIAKTASEDATRTIIRRTIEERGSKINDAVTFGGTLEGLIFWAEDFDGTTESEIRLDTVEFDFEIQVNDWTLGSIVLEYDDGQRFRTQTVTDAVDRINVDTAFITIGNTQKCWLFGTMGRIIAPFGISTGDPLTDVLSIESPLTVEVFETKEDVILIGFEGPTPPPPPPISATAKTPLPPGPPPVRPLLIYPHFRDFARSYCRGVACVPPPAATPPPPAPLVPPLIPYNGAIYFYNDEDNDINQMGATLGYKSRGVFPNCMPWTVDVDVDFNTSVFQSRFLSLEYENFLPEIDTVPGMAAHIKSSIGPVALVLEWNGALRQATFTDDLGTPISIAPGAWQVALAYQFDWNPTVQMIGAQGTFVAVGYSQSYDMAGAIQLIDAQPTRVGFVPKSLLTATVGEWVLEGLRVAFEYNYSVDYARGEGGTGNSAHGVFGQLSYQW